MGISQPAKPVFMHKQLSVWMPKPEARGAMRRCSFDLPVRLASRFRAVCLLQGHSMRDVAQLLLEAYVEQHGEMLP